MISRRPFFGALMVSLFACGDNYQYIPEPAPEPPAKAPLPNDCVNPAVRNELGTVTTGKKTIRIRARIAQNSLGAIAVEDETQIANDLFVLNKRFESTDLQFVLDDVALLEKDDAVFQATRNLLCDEPFKPLSEDAIPMLYVGNLVLSSGQARGTGSACGAMINARINDSQFDKVSGIFSNTEAVPRMMGYVLGLLQTHACYNIPGYESDPQLSGDLVGDTPVDPGSSNIFFSCGGAAAPGNCVFVDEAACYVQCADGSMPDVHNIMSSYVGCRDRFSDGQAVYMRCAVELHHSKAKCNNVWANILGTDWFGQSDGVQVGDVDGDGKADAIIHYENESPPMWRVALSTGSQFAPSSIWSQGFTGNLLFPRRMIGDVDGDNKADAVLEVFDDWHVSLSTGTSFAASTVWRAGFKGHSMLADVDGDGKADGVTFDAMADRLSVALSTGSAFAEPAVWLDGFGVDSYEPNLGDFNGDGKADAIAFTKVQNAKLETICKWEVAQSTGSAFNASKTWYEHECPGYQNWVVADMDGDKKSDLVVFRYDISAWFVHYSNGSAFGPPRLAIGGLGRIHDVPLAGDIDGDGKANIISFDASRGRWQTNICLSEDSAD
jgi:FG-GAP-like repeat